MTARFDLRLRAVAAAALAVCVLLSHETTFAVTQEEAESQAQEAAASNPAAEDSTAAEAEVDKVAVAGLDWHTDYYAAYRDAHRDQKMLLVNFVGGREADQQSVEQRIASDANLQTKLSEMVLVRLPVETTIDIEGKETRLLSHRSFAEMHGRAGIAILDLEHADRPYFGHVVSAFPYMDSKYYHWRSDYLPVIVSLPPGTLTQRSMVWAVRVHPEHPASTTGVLNPQLANAAASHSQHQANIQRQGHHNWDSRFHQVRSMVNVGQASEVVAESWPNQTMIDSCLDCVDSWRHSSGHWGAVRRQHRFFAYDIRRGRNGIWYGTGIFGN